MAYSLGLRPTHCRTTDTTDRVEMRCPPSPLGRKQPFSVSEIPCTKSCKAERGRTVFASVAHSLKNGQRCPFQAAPSLDLPVCITTAPPLGTALASRSIQLFQAKSKIRSNIPLAHTQLALTAIVLILNTCVTAPSPCNANPAFKAANNCALVRHSSEKLCIG